MTDPRWTARAALSIAILTAAGGLARADPRPPEEVAATSHVESAGLFKNGLAVIRRTAHLGGPGVYRVDDMPAPIHGTFWVESDLPIETRVTTRMVQEPPTAGGGAVDVQQDLVGQTVTIHYRVPHLPATVGRVVSVPPAKTTATGGYDAANAYRYSWGYPPYDGTPSGPGTFLVVETATGRTYADLSQVAAIEAAGGGAATVARRRPVLLLTVPPSATTGGDVRIDYLAPGLSWSPAYRAKLGDDGKLTVEQQAVVKNELSDLNDTDLSLISGFPSVRFATVTSPLAVSRTWDDFFQQLAAAQSGDYDGSASVLSNSGIQSQQAANNTADTRRGVDPSAPPAGESADIHYHSIGRRTLAQGDALLTTVASAGADYRRLVQWRVRDPNEVEPRGRNGRQGDDAQADQPWDVVRFVNPFPFPMTTGPIVLVAGGHFSAQALSDWTNPGSPDTIRVTRALSVAARSAVAEDPGAQRQDVVVLGHPHVQVTMRGDLTFANHRATPVTLEVVRDLWGELLSADGTPERVPQENSVDDLQRHWTLRWTVTLKPGEEGRLAYRYTTIEY